jgi:SAM-dependent methyltransferase
MHPEAVHRLDPESLDLFAAKGLPAGAAIGGRNFNAVKVRRVMQVMRDLARPDGGALRVLDLACGEGVYSIEAALRGADVVAVDARTERMEGGVAAARRLGLANLRFEQRDIRQITSATHGSFDVILILGILYHLDVPDLLPFLENVRAMCRRIAVIDTHISHDALVRVEDRGRAYEGRWYEEHGATDSAEVRRGRLTASIDNPRSFWPTRDSLQAMLAHAGFTSVFECHLPREPQKPSDRITLVAAAGSPVQISAYPWINALSEIDLQKELRAAGDAVPKPGPGFRSIAGHVRGVVNRALRPLGLQVNRL